MKKRLTFFTAGEDTFLKDIVVNLRKDYNVKFCQRPEEQEFFQEYHNTDIAWFEWCDGLFENAMQHPKPCKIINRMHSYELFTPIPGSIDWNKVDKLILVNNTCKQIAMDKFRIRPDIMTVINNGVDVERLKIPQDKKYNKKIAFVGFLNYKKAPDLLLHTFYNIWKHDPSFEFHIAGDFQDERYVLYFNSIMPHMPFKLHFDGWVQDMPKYLEDKDYVISTSLFESFQYSIAEGMSQGVIPLVHGWWGADQLYPKKYVFYNLDEPVDIIKEFEQSNKEEERNKVRQHIIRNFSLEKQIKEIKDVLETL